MFWDSSAVVPILIAEAQSAEAMALLAGDRTPTIWWGASLECMSALHRRHREGSLSSDTFAGARRRLEDLAADVDIVAPTAKLLQIARNALSDHPLRAADALQLGAALVWADGFAAGERFVCLDDRLRSAAIQEGFLVLPTDR